MYIKKEFRVSVEFCVYKHELEKTKYDESNMEELVNDILIGEMNNSLDDGPLWIQCIHILDTDNEWEIEY